MATLKFLDVDNKDLSSRISPRCHPTLDMTEAEASDQRFQEVLHVRIQREDGQIAHIHFAVGLNNRGQPFGEVTAIGNSPHQQVVRKAGAKWREPIIKRQ